MSKGRCTYAADQHYLGEAEGKVRGRGAHATAADAAVAFADGNCTRHLLLIEWKYTEEYRSHSLSAHLKGKRQARYSDKLFAPDGPVKGDSGLALSDILHEPFYQLARQQMLAWQIEKTSPAFDRVRVLHLSREGNRALHEVTSPAFNQFGGAKYDDAFAAWQACHADPAWFIERSIERAFAPLALYPEADWWPLLVARYSTLCQGKSA